MPPEDEFWASWPNNDSDSDNAEENPEFADETAQRESCIASIMSQVQQLQKTSGVLYIEFPNDVLEIGPEDSQDDVLPILQHCKTEDLRMLSCMRYCSEGNKPISCRKMHPLAQRLKEKGPGTIHSLKELFTFPDGIDMPNNEDIVSYYLEALPRVPSDDQKEEILFPLLTIAEPVVYVMIKQYLMQSGMEAEALTELERKLGRHRHESLRSFREKTDHSPQPILLSTIAQLRTIMQNVDPKDQPNMLAAYLHSLPDTMPDDRVENIIFPLLQEKNIDLQLIWATLRRLGYETDNNTYVWKRARSIAPYAGDYRSQYYENERSK